MKKFIRYLYYLSAFIFFKIVQLIPFRLAVKIGGMLGSLAYDLISEARKTALANLTGAFPEKKSDEIRKIARKVFIDQGKNLFELFSFQKLSKESLLSLTKIDNEQELFSPINSGKGIIMASAHCGNWEIMGASFALKGLPVNVIARKIYIEKLNSMLVGFRESKGMKVILRSGKDAARLMLKALKNKEILALLIDQDTDVPSVFVNFFGKPAWTPSAVAVLALRTDAAVVVALDKRMPDDTHLSIIRPVRIKKTGDMEKDVIYNTQMISDMIEEHIRQNPEQWVWMHKRWKTRPRG